MVDESACQSPGVGQAADDTPVLEQPQHLSSSDPAAALFKAEGYGKVEAWVRVAKPSAAAKRKKTQREKMKSDGMDQLNLVVPIDGPARELLHHLARTDLGATWSEAARTVAANRQIAELDRHGSLQRMRNVITPCR